MSLTDLDIKHRIGIPLEGLGPATPTRFPLTALGSPEYPWQLKNISGISTSGAAIMIVGVAVRDELNNLIFNVGLAPWLLANTTVNSNSNQTPDIVAVSFFSIIIGFNIPSDFYVYSDWVLEVTLLNPLVGSSYDLTANCMQGFFRDKYRLSA